METLVALSKKVLNIIKWFIYIVVAVIPTLPLTWYWMIKYEDADYPRGIHGFELAVNNYIDSVAYLLKLNRF